MRRGCVLTIVILSGIAFFISAISFIFFWPKMKKRETSRIISAIEITLEEYKSDQGNYPESVENSAVTDALHFGKNPREKVYLPNAYVKDGEFVDFWKNPLRIEYPEPKDGTEAKPKVSSAGPNGEFGDDDDITSQLIKDEMEKRGQK